MGVIEFLDESGVKYEVTEHQPTFTAQRMAAVEHEPGRYVAKPVIVKADAKYVMCVLSACYKIDLEKLTDAFLEEVPLEFSNDEDSHDDEDSENLLDEQGAPDVDEEGRVNEDIEWDRYLPKDDTGRIERELRQKLLSLYLEPVGNW